MTTQRFPLFKFSYSTALDSSVKYQWHHVLRAENPVAVLDIISQPDGTLHHDSVLKIVSKGIRLVSLGFLSGDSFAWKGFLSAALLTMLWYPLGIRLFRTNTTASTP